MSEAYTGGSVCGAPGVELKVHSRPQVGAAEADRNALTLGDFELDLGPIARRAIAVDATAFHPIFRLEVGAIAKSGDQALGVGGRVKAARSAATDHAQELANKVRHFGESLYFRAHNQITIAVGALQS